MPDASNQITMQQQTQEEQTQSQRPLVDMQAPLSHVVGAPLSVPTTLTRDQMKSLNGRLAARDRAVQANAESELYSMKPAELVAFLAYERQARKRRIRNSGISFVALFLFMTVMTIANPKMNMFIYMGSFSGMIGAASAFSKGNKFGAMALARCENTDHVGELISALEIPEKDVQDSVRPALLRLLPRLRASDSHLIDVEMRATLRRFLTGKLTWLRKGTTNIATDTSLAIGILEALRQVGDNSFIELVTQIANSKGRWIDPRVAIAAQECLPYLEQISRQARASSELLRGSEANILSGADTLVRAVVAPTDLHEAELLRGARSGEEP